jgi:O-acetyl-ADP-ribose deacetylase (regulator of RNase III)
MFTQRSGDLIKSPDNDGFIVHGCNAQGVMGGGIALTIKQHWPQVYKDYRYTKMQSITGEIKMGSIIPVPIDRDRVVINAITQRYYSGHPYAQDGCQVDYEALLHCFEQINDLPNQYPHIKPILHFPSIGAGLARGDWSVISEIIDTTITNLEKVHWML